ncbi:hypothetical protein BUALT_Bualt17G0071900 [Buddleja alternifolia]|uniref:Uncharacterized protein n=1 Tax=Buddleja alternifolia TaxID=168488 RepID=A0AAV6WFW1_9LAMI|nr:hypothetical protein BUALT_Bualt17G0071900 [Buddleja alternifolia]
MYLNLFKLDIDELINEFVECESTTFAEFKRIWLSKKFSYLRRALQPTKVSSCSHYMHIPLVTWFQLALSHIEWVGCIACTACMKPSRSSHLSKFIYLLNKVNLVIHFERWAAAYFGQGEMRQLKNLVIDSKRTGVKVVSVLVKSMLEKNMFLFGFVGTNEGSVTERVNELTDLQNARVQAAYKKLFANSRLEHFIHMDLGMELDVDLLKKKSSDYAVAKELAIKEASQAIDVENVKHIAEKRRLIGETVEKSAADWNEQKEMFYERTGFDHPPTIAAEENDNRKRKEPCDNVEEHDDFGTELERVLLFQPLESDNEEVEPTDDWENDT